MYGPNTIYVDFNIGTLSAYEITPPQAIRTMPVSRELQLVRPQSLHQRASLVHAVISISLVLIYSTYSVQDCRKLEYYACSLNQLV